MKKFILILTAVLVLLLLAAAPFERAVTAIDWWAVGASSSTLSSGAITLDSVVGQSIAGPAGGGLSSGYLSVFIENLALIYLPLVIK